MERGATGLPDEVTVRAGVGLRLRRWPGGQPGFLLLHGLASNARTWDPVARHLWAQGHAVVAPDLRGHGRSERPASGYDPAAVAADVALLLDALGWRRPLVVGQSWGGNVALEFGARHPGRAAGLAFVDGGWIALRDRAGSTWERTEAELRPPDLRGTPWGAVRERVRAANPEWSEEAVDAVMGCFERLADGSVRPWLSLDRHLEILRGLWEQDPPRLYPRVTEPVVLCAADDGSRQAAQRRRWVAQARRGLSRSSLHWFPGTHHDIHLHRPGLLADTLLGEVRGGVWSGPG